MGQPEFPHDERPLVEARLLRTRDLVDLRLEAFGCTIEPTDGAAELVAGPDASLVVHFPPQHVGEEILDAAAPPPDPDRRSSHVAAGPTRLVYAIPEATRIAYTLQDLLEALTGLQLRVAPNATPAGEAAEEQRAPALPEYLETAIEAPYHLIVSPSARGAFRHSATPVGPVVPGPDGTDGPPGPVDRAELWRTHLVVRENDGPADEDPDRQRIVRALWNRDEDLVPPDFRQPLRTLERDAIVAQTHGGNPANAATPLRVSNLSLSSLGAWFDWRQSWEFGETLVDYRHQSFMGRDGYVRVAYPGFLYPFGHRCHLVEISERAVKRREAPVAFLWQRRFIVVRQPTLAYAEDARDNPFAQVTLSPLVTPDLDSPPNDREPFLPTRDGTPFPFTLVTVDRGGETRSWQAPLVFVPVEKREDQTVILRPERASGVYQPVRQIQGRGQVLAMAKPVKAGDTSVEVGHLVFDGHIDTANLTSRPFLIEARAVVPAMRHLSPQAPAVDLTYAQPYLDHGLPERLNNDRPGPGTPNIGELVLALKNAPAAVDFSSGSDRAGGFVSPNLAVRGLSRSLGAVGTKGDPAFQAGKFDPLSFLSGALPKLFGLFSLADLLVAADLDQAPAFVSDALDAVSKLGTEATRLRTALGDAQARLAHEVTHAAHGGARAVAEHAKAELDARAGSLTTHLDDLVAALPGLPGNTTGVSAAAGELLKDLKLLLDALGAPGVPAAVRSALQKPAQTLVTLTGLAEDVTRLQEMVQGAVGGQVTARLSWRPTIKSWGLDDAPAIFEPTEPRGLHIDVEVRASASAPPAVDIVAELVDFNLNLIGNGPAGLMQLMFRRVGFHAGSAGKPEVDVVFGGIRFLGPLSFVDRLRELIPFDGFSDPPYVDVGPEGITAGFDLTLPNVSVGVFSLENIALGADARIPFLGDAMTVGFHFCSKDAPFRLTVMAVGGGGWLGLRVSPKGMVLLELGLEACASLSVDLGVASGSVSIAVGVYLRLEADRGLLTAYFRIRGEVDVLGLISASITLELSLTYHFETGKLIGRASLVVEVEVLFFSASVEISVERKLAGSKGDPTMYEVMPPDPGDPGGVNADWVEYCDAFAPVPA